MAYGFHKMKVPFSFFLPALILFSQLVFAAPGAPLPGPAFDVSQIGVAAAVRGVVKISKTSTVGRDVQSGEPIFLGDNISTDANSNLQILLLDQTVFTIGPNSTIVVDKFVYDPGTNDGALNAKVVKGVFRFVTGKIGHKDPKKVNIELPSGTIGIRGTMVAGKVDGKHSLVILLGPGEQNNTSSRRGAIIVSDKGTSTFVGRAGFGTELDGQNPPKEPFLVPANLIKEIDTRIGDISLVGGEDQDKNQNQNKNQNTGNRNPNGPGPNDPKGEPRGNGESATRQAGQDKAGAGGDVKQILNTGRIFTKLDRESDRASQGKVQDEFHGGGGFDGATRFEQLSRFKTGTIKFAQTNVPIFNLASKLQDGQYDITFEIDLGRGKMGTGASGVSGSFHSIPFILDIEEQDFGSPKQVAAYSFSADNASDSGIPAYMTVAGTITPLNANGNIAQSIGHSLSVVYDTGSVSAEGAGGGLAPRDSAGGDSGVGVK